MKITYAVTVCNEFIEIQQLIAFLLKHKRLQDEIVVQMDLNLGDINNQTEDKNQVFAYLMKHQEQGHIRVIFYPLNNDFAKLSPQDYQTLVKLMQQFDGMQEKNDALFDFTSDYVDPMTYEDAANVELFYSTIAKKGKAKFPQASKVAAAIAVIVAKAI
jgi:hypothetical protein